MTDPAFVKAYPLLLHELKCTFDAVDPIKAMHSPPPSLLNVSVEFEQERAPQSQARCEELLDGSSGRLITGQQ